MREGIHYPQSGYGQVPYNSDCDAPTAAMDPYTTQILNRLMETEKYVAEITIQLSRIADKLVGAVPEPATLGGGEGLNRIPKTSGMMEQIVSQANLLNRKVMSLGETINRLQSL